MAETEIPTQIPPEANVTGLNLAKARSRLYRAAIPILLPILAVACSGKEIKAEPVFQNETITPTPVVLQTETPLPSVTALAETQTPTPTPKTPITKGQEPTPTPTPEPTPAESQAETSIFQEIIQKIDQTTGTDAEKAQAHEMVNKFVKAEQTISGFNNYELQRQTLGETTLLQLTQQKFNRLGDAFLEFTVEDQVFYLKDDKDLKTLAIRLKDASPQELLSSVAKSHEQFFNSDIPAGRRRMAYITPESVQAKIIEFDITKTTSPKAPDAVEAFKTFLKEMGVEGQINLKIVLADKLSMGNAAGTFSDMEDVPEIEIAPPFSIASLAHEITHLLDPEFNSFLYAQLSPQEIVDLEILKLKTLSDPEWGRNYPQIERLFSKDATTSFLKQVNQQPLTAKEFVAAIIFPRDWLFSSDVDRFNPPKDIVINDMQVLDNKFNRKFDQEFANRLDKYTKISAFITGEAQFLNQITSDPQSTAWDKTWIELLKESANYINNLGIFGELSATHLRRVFIFDAALNADPRVDQLITSLAPAQRIKLLDSFLNYFNSTDNELLANAVEATLAQKLNGQELKLIEASNNPHNAYIKTAIRLLPR